MLTRRAESETIIIYGSSEQLLVLYATATCKISKHKRVEGNDSTNPTAEVLKHARRQQLFAVYKKSLNVMGFI